MEETVTVTDLSEEDNSLSPTQKALLENTNAPVEFTLVNGKKIAFKKPSGVISFKIAKFLGQESMNPAMNLYYRMLFHLASINGKPCRPPNSALEIEALGERLGDEAVFDDAVMKFTEWAMDQTGEDDPAKK